MPAGHIKKFKFLAGILTHHLTKQRKPLFVVLTVTNRCNMRCIYCFGRYGQKMVEDFSTEQLFTLIDELAQAGATIISLSGGEPLLREDIGDIITRIKNNGMLCLMNTNGLLVKKRFHSLSRLDSICIGFDGNANENDLNRGSGSFEKIIAGIQAAQGLKIPVHTVCVLTKHNIRAIDYIVGLGKKMGFQAEFNFPCGLLSEESDHLATKEEYQNAVEKIISLKKNGYPILFSRTAYEFALQWLRTFDKPVCFADECARMKLPPCYAGHLECFIDADGSLYPCYQLIGRYPASNVKEAGFMKAWSQLHKDITCKSCLSICSIEHNYIFGLKYRVIGNYVKDTIFNRSYAHTKEPTICL